MRNQKLAELLHQYFELGVAEGREGRKHDTEAGDAQRVLSEIEAEIAALSAEPVASIVPEHCSGSAFVFEGGCLHVRKDGSGHIVVDEADFTLEDDRREGEHGPEGSVHWIARFPAGEMTALRHFLNGQGSSALSAQAQGDEETKVAIALGASVLSKIADPATREIAIRNALTAASISAAQMQDVAGTVEAFDRDHPELYWHIAKGKITAGEPLYGAIIIDIRGNELGDGESNVSAIDAFKFAVDDAALPAAPAKQEG